MIFRITRTSNYSSENPRVSKQFKIFDDEEYWYIEINSLEELIELKDDTGKLILETEWDDDVSDEVKNRIEIYDDYRE